MARGDKILIWLTLAVLALSIVQITLGGVVRVTGSGDACPDWPVCFGSWIPPLDDWRVGLEWGHRASGVLLGLTAIAATLTAILLTTIFKRREHQATALMLAASLILITITGVIGGTVVLSELNPVLRTAHLLMAQFVVLTTCAALIFELRPRALEAARARARAGNILGGGALVAVLVIIISGAYAVWQGAGLVCQSYPICDFNAGILPRGELEWINMAHRIATAVAALFILYGAHFIMRRSGGLVKFAAIMVLAAIFVEILLGAAVASTIRTVAGNNDLLWLLNMWRGLHIGASSVVWTFAALMALGWSASHSKRFGRADAPRPLKTD